MRRTPAKIDSTGVYLPFSGLTTLSFVDSKKQCWQSVSALLNNTLIKRYYAPLPLESYHMTLFSLMNERESTPWVETANKYIAPLRQLKKNLRDSNLTPVVKYEGLRTEGVIQLHLAGLTKQVKEIKRLKSFLFSPPIALDALHVTLAYQFKTVAEADKEKLSALFVSIHKTLMKLLGKTSTKLLPAQLCYFKNMTLFKPWDGSEGVTRIPSSTSP
jgi:hypothetical protein